MKLTPRQRKLKDVMDTYREEHGKEAPKAYLAAELVTSITRITDLMEKLNRKLKEME